jgi:quercetin dioxygenase-like cupin family protein
MSAPILVRSADAEVLTASGVTLLADTPATNGHLTSHRSTFQPGKEGAPPHLHREASELFYVLTGNLRVLTDETLTTLHTGDFLVVLPNTPHAFEAAGNSPAEVLFVLTHAKPRFDYYRLHEGVYRGDTDPTVLATTSNTYDNHYIESPTWSAR